MMIFIFVMTKQMKMSNLYACCLDYYLVHRMSTTNLEYVNPDFFHETHVLSTFLVENQES